MIYFSGKPERLPFFVLFLAMRMIFEKTNQKAAMSFVHFGTFIRPLKSRALFMGSEKRVMDQNRTVGAPSQGLINQWSGFSGKERSLKAHSGL